MRIRRVGREWATADLRRPSLLPGPSWPGRRPDWKAHCRGRGTATSRTKQRGRRRHAVDRSCRTPETAQAVHREKTCCAPRALCGVFPGVHPSRHRYARASTRHRDKTGRDPSGQRGSVPEGLGARTKQLDPVVAAVTANARNRQRTVPRRRRNAGRRSGASLRPARRCRQSSSGQDPRHRAGPQPRRRYADAWCPPARPA